MQEQRTHGDAIGLAELMAALSVATDLAMGQPLEYALHACVVAMRLADALGMGGGELAEVYYQALLRYIGCNAETSMLAAIVGDELALRADYVAIDSANPAEVIGTIVRFIRQANAGATALQMAQAVVSGVLASARTVDDFLGGHCEVARRLGERMGFGERITRGLGQLYARWDGKGTPSIKGHEVMPAVLVVTLAQDVVTFHRLGGLEAAVKVARERRGAAYAPWMADCFCARAAQLLAGLDDLGWADVLALDPEPRAQLSGAQLDAACLAIADFADIKSPYTLGHSSGVAQLAAEAARYGRLTAPDVATIYRAGLLHDIGRVGVSAGVWGKPGPLSDREREKVRLHTYYTERVLARPAGLARLGALAALHHERLDGSGYHRGLPATLLSPSARLLAAADVYHALCEPRPHRPAFAPEAAAAELRREVRAGRLDGDAVQCVLAAAGHATGSARPERPAGLSEREIEVLRLLARGHTMQQIAERLVISKKTVDSHIQHIYTKIGVSTRAGATLFAMEQLLLDATD
ncbi:MAG TPA: HD domain-containing phosphohydrolase [Kouleothrix sp.]|uniref:HD domain-containing phosphohydrolase n=1 Tax=Kouleothrix sp. TaxID=2779161 RepID=UPI002BB13ACB|nr:HD domain-containing phosphohydrolase [Kouleothrix sp.]